MDRLILYSMVLTFIYSTTTTAILQFKYPNYLDAIIANQDDQIASKNEESNEERKPIIDHKHSLSKRQIYDNIITKSSDSNADIHSRQQGIQPGIVPFQQNLFDHTNVNNNNLIAARPINNGINNNLLLSGVYDDEINLGDLSPISNITIDPAPATFTSTNVADCLKSTSCALGLALFIGLFGTFAISLPLLGPVFLSGRKKRSSNTIDDSLIQAHLFLENYKNLIKKYDKYSTQTSNTAQTKTNQDQQNIDFDTNMMKNSWPTIKTHTPFHQNNNKTNDAVVNFIPKITYTDISKYPIKSINKHSNLILSSIITKPPISNLGSLNSPLHRGSSAISLIYKTTTAPKLNFDNILKNYILYNNQHHTENNYPSQNNNPFGHQNLSFKPIRIPSIYDDKYIINNDEYISDENKLVEMTTKQAGKIVNFYRNICNVSRDNATTNKIIDFINSQCTILFNAGWI